MALHPGVHLVSAKKAAKKPASATGTWGASPKQTAVAPARPAAKASGSRISGTGHASTSYMTERTPEGGTALFAYGPGGRWTLVAKQADRPRPSIPSGSGGSGGSSGQQVAADDYSSHDGGGVTTGGAAGGRLNTGPTYYENPAPITAAPGYTIEPTQPGIVGGTITGPGFGGTGFDVSAPFTVVQPGPGGGAWTLPPGLLAGTPAFYDPGYDPGSSGYLFAPTTSMDASGNVIGGLDPAHLGLDGFPATFGDTPASGGADSGSGSPWSDAGSGGFF